jgi:predicted nuclease with TOPRIM domain
MSNNNQNEGKVNESRRDLPIYNKEQKTLHSLTELAREKFNKFKDDPEKIESFLELCENFEVNILEVLVEVDLKNCPGVFFKYLRDENYERNSTEYIRGFKKMLSQIQSNTKERDEIINFVRDIGKNMIGEGDKELRELAVDYLAFWARQELK